LRSRTSLTFRRGAYQQDLGGELAFAQQLADAVALPGGRRQLRRGPEAAPQLAFDGGGTVNVTGGDGSDVLPWLSTATTS